MAGIVIMFFGGGGGVIVVIPDGTFSGSPMMDTPFGG